jgi:hypothetical protein
MYVLVILIKMVGNIESVRTDDSKGNMLPMKQFVIITIFLRAGTAQSV